MRVLIHAPSPPAARRAAGSARRYLDGLVAQLLTAGVPVTVVCPRGHGTGGTPAAGLAVVDRLRVAEAADGAQLDPADVHHDMCLLRRLAGQADAIVTVDRHLPVEVPVPVVLLLTGLSHGAQVRGVFGCSWDAVVVPSDHLRQAVCRYMPPESWVPTAPRVCVIAPATAPGGSGGRRRCAESWLALLATLDKRASRYLPAAVGAR